MRPWVSTADRVFHADRMPARLRSPSLPPAARSVHRVTACADAASRAAGPFARAALGWALVKLVGGSTVKSRTATLTTALTGAVAGLTGYALVPVGAAILLALSAGAITAATVWASPASGLLVAMRDD